MTSSKLAVPVSGCSSWAPVAVQSHNAGAQTLVAVIEPANGATYFGEVRGVRDVHENSARRDGARV
jgi:hypothetical protein